MSFSFEVIPAWGFGKHKQIVANYQETTFHFMWFYFIVRRTLFKPGENVLPISLKGRK